ncbi:ABC transporter permease [Kiloniella antarctica]|uniref:ABC transporter permease n=1 Tax=Kiloniella antarctica TaxID=1550907 RepID=A0ABW5BK39_9PROT
MAWFVENTSGFFRLTAWLMDFPMGWVRELLQWLPWTVVVFVFMLVSYRAGKTALVIFTGSSFAYILFVGLWVESMNSLALVAISVPFAVLLGFFLGVIGYLSHRAERIIVPILDITQTIPAFAYLLPILLLFGFGPVVGLIASIIFAFPPMVRNTIVGLRNVPLDIIESGQMSGATVLQLFWRVRFPSALQQILLGVNQTTMASLSMIIIASIIGGSADIGWEVLSTMRKAQFGESLVAGVVIALLAMVLDRITRGLAVRKVNEYEVQNQRLKYLLMVGSTGMVIILLISAQLIPALNTWPDAWVLDPSTPLNEMISWFVLTFKPVLDTLKNSFVFFFMLPLKIGLNTAVSPFTWGFSLTIWHTAAFMVIVASIAAYFLKAKKQTKAITTLLFGMIIFIGLTEMPWPAMVVIIVGFAYRVGGRSLALGTSAAIAFLLLSGSWEKALLSLYLCCIAVSLSFLIGTTLGIFAASNDRFSRFMQPINDTLQTMPPFVLLIPIVMIFKIGEFTAILAIISYAYVPAFRYTEYGLRNVSAEVVEAATCMGCSPLQLLFRVKLPLAMPNIMLGLNQSIMYGIAMLVIAALVGTDGLGQQVYIGLSKGDFGIGFLAGIGMAIIAITADRFCLAWQKKYENSRTLSE